MYVLTTLPFVYLGTSYFYNKYKQINYKPPSATPEFIQGRLSALLAGVSKASYYKLISLTSAASQAYINKLSSNFKEHTDYNLKDLIAEYGAETMAMAMKATLEGLDLDLSSLPYQYLPYNKFIIGGIALAGTADFLHSLKVTPSSTMNTIHTLGLKTIVSYYKMIGYFDNNNNYTINTQKLQMDAKINHLIQTYGIKIIPLLNFTAFDVFDLCALINRHGQKIIPLLKEAGYNFNNLPSYDVSYIISVYAEKGFNWLKQAGYNFNKLSSHDAKNIIIERGEKSFNWLKQVGYNFNKLSSHDAKNIIIERGEKAFNWLKQAGYNFNNLPSHDASYIISVYEEKGFNWLKEAEFDFNKLSSHDAKNIIIERGEKGFNWLKQAGYNFNNLPSHDAKNIIIERGEKGFNWLKQAGYNFNNLSSYNAASIIIKHGEKGFNWLKEAEFNAINSSLLLSQRLNNIDYIKKDCGMSDLTLDTQKILSVIQNNNNIINMIRQNYVKCLMAIGFKFNMLNELSNQKLNDLQKILSTGNEKYINNNDVFRSFNISYNCSKEVLLEKTIYRQKLQQEDAKVLADFGITESNTFLLNFPINELKETISIIQNNKNTISTFIIAHSECLSFSNFSFKKLHDLSHEKILKLQQELAIDPRQSIQDAWDYLGISLINNKNLACFALHECFPNMNSVPAPTGATIQIADLE